MFDVLDGQLSEKIILHLNKKLNSD